MENKCIIENCNKKLKCKGLCSAHYSKKLRYGDPLKCSDKPKTEFCIIDGCTVRAKSRLMCARHYQIDYRRTTGKNSYYFLKRKK